MNFFFELVAADMVATGLIIFGAFALARWMDHRDGK